METSNKIGYSLLTVVLLVSLGLNVSPDDTHFCSDRNITYHCDGLSKYYGLDNGKCINELGPNKLCSSGWEEIFPESEIEEVEPVKKSKKYICDQFDCKEIE